MVKLRAWAYRWLPRICGCHCRPERSFFFRGRQAPVCARCTGELVGIPMALVSCLFWRAPWWAALLLMLPMLADGVVQLLTRYESTNPRRFVTGLLFGLGLVFSLAALGELSYAMGYHFVKSRM